MLVSSNSLSYMSWSLESSTSTRRATNGALPPMWEVAKSSFPNGCKTQEHKEDPVLVTPSMHTGKTQAQLSPPESLAGDPAAVHQPMCWYLLSAVPLTPPPAIPRRNPCILTACGGRAKHISKQTSRDVWCHTWNKPLLQKSGLSIIGQDQKTHVKEQQNI